MKTIPGLRLNTLPVVEHYRKAGTLLEVDGTKDPIALFGDIREHVVLHLAYRLCDSKQHADGIASGKREAPRNGDAYCGGSDSTGHFYSGAQWDYRANHSTTRERAGVQRLWRGIMASLFRLRFARRSTMRWCMASRKRNIIQDGDLVKIDMGLRYQGMK